MAKQTTPKLTAGYTALGPNVSYRIEGDLLHVVMDVSAAQHGRSATSASGKNVVVASTKGNQGVPVQGIPGLMLGINAYAPPRTK